MAKSPVIITVKQAKKQINHFGRSLILYIIFFMVIYYGFDHLEKYMPGIFQGRDPQIIRLAASSILMLIALIPFSISASFLHLDIRDYLHNARLRSDRVFALICIGICLYLVTTSISTLFYFFFHTEIVTYDFLGNFSTQINVVKNILYLVFFVLVEPICDELIFRGLIQRQLGHYGRYFGVLGSAVLYAISRMNMVEAVPAFILGWYFALITLRYHSIRPAIGVHISIQLFRWIINVIPGNLLWALNILIVILYVAAGLFIFQKRVDTSMVRYGATEGKLWKILLTSSSIDVCIVLFAVNIILSFHLY